MTGAMSVRCHAAQSADPAPPTAGARCAKRRRNLRPYAGAAGELGFNRLAIVHASWFIRPGRRLIFHHNFDEWGEIFVARRYYRHDPALLYSQRTNRPFSWRELRWELPPDPKQARSEEHTSELQSLMRISYAVFCLQNK